VSYRRSSHNRLIILQARAVSQNTRAVAPFVGRQAAPRLLMDAVRDSRDLKSDNVASDMKAEALARSDTVGALLAQRDHMKERLTLRESIFLLLADPSSSRAAWAFGVLMWVVILASSFCFVYETMNWVTDLTGSTLWLYARIGIQGFFSVEALVRTLTFVPFRRAYTDVFVWLDILTVIPFWSRLILYPDSLTPEYYLDNAARSMLVRILESISMVRLFKLVKYYEGSRLIARAVLKSLSQLLVPLFMLFAMVMLFSMIMYDLEYDTSIEWCSKLWRAHGLTTAFFAAHPGGVDWGCEACSLASSRPGGNGTLQQLCLSCEGYPPQHPECLGVAFEQNFRDLPATMWFTMVTVTTVGYGDISPATWRGQFFGAFVIMSGIVFLAMPLAIVGNNFAKTFEERSLVKLQSLIRHLLLQNGISAADVVIAYRQIDDNGDGLISFREFLEFCKATLRLKLSKAELYSLWRQLDINDSGVINFSEFTSVIFPHINVEAITDTSAPPQEMSKLQEEALEDDRLEDDDGRATAATLAAAIASAKEQDRTRSGSGGIDQDTAAELLAAIHSLRKVVESTNTRVGAIESSHAVLASRFDAIDAALAARQARRDRSSSHLSPPTKDAPPPPEAPRRRRRRAAEPAGPDLAS
jgi:hypothetical protein